MKYLVMAVAATLALAGCSGSNDAAQQAEIERLKAETEKLRVEAERMRQENAEWEAGQKVREAERKQHERMAEIFGPK